MSDRAAKMVELARSLPERRNNEVTLGTSGTSHVENASTNIQKYRDANEPENFIPERPCDGRFQNYYSNFVPCVQNETMSSIHGIEFNLTVIESLHNPKKLSHEAHEDVLPHSGEFDSDNSIRDPDFNLSRSATSMDCSSNDEETSHQRDNLNGLAKPKSKSKKKLRRDLRNRRKSYTTCSGRIVKARVCNPSFDLCRNKCKKNLQLNK
ncbi:uncharacterized protein [Eurosta solidaginis]|uniref:uncharacterized protein n=1 Tax=Eurosta solidaginis TaxID=178769 RepID=UPI0035310E23